MMSGDGGGVEVRVKMRAFNNFMKCPFVSADVQVCLCVVQHAVTYLNPACCAIVVYESLDSVSITW